MAFDSLIGLHGYIEYIGYIRLYLYGLYGMDDRLWIYGFGFRF
jgi:hypothetical protein